MRILLAHNFYQQPGGEDASFAAEAAMLRDHGHDVVEYSLSNHSIPGQSLVGIAARAIWNERTYRDLRRLMRERRPQVAHFTNTFPLISPSAYYAAHAEGVAVVQALRNFRLLCPNGLLFRDGSVCHKCVRKRVAWPGVVHACYRDSRAATAAVVAMLGAHRALRTWEDAVDFYLTPTEFSRLQFVAAGFPAARIAVKPNFVLPDPGPGPGAGGYALFVGRLSKEKGVGTLLSAWETLHEEVPLRIVGDGPEAPAVEQAAAACSGIEWMGRRSSAEVLALVGDASFLVFPSEWYETFGRVVIEAYATGTPVIASRLGAMTELVADGRTGLSFEAGSVPDLVRVVRALARDPARLSEMRHAARREYDERYTADRNHGILMAIYARSMERHRRCG